MVSILIFLTYHYTSKEYKRIFRIQTWIMNTKRDFFFKLKLGRKNSGDRKELGSVGLFTFSLWSSPRSHVGQRLYFHRPLWSLHDQGTIRQGWLHQQFRPWGHSRHSRWLDIGTYRSHTAWGWRGLLGKISIRWNLRKEAQVLQY